MVLRPILYVSHDAHKVVRSQDAWDSRRGNIAATEQTMPATYGSLDAHNKAKWNLRYKLQHMQYSYQYTLQTYVL